MLTPRNKDGPLNLKAHEHRQPVNDHVGYALDLDEIFNQAATTENPVITYIPARFLTDVAQPVVLALLAAGGNQIIPGVTYDPTSTPKLTIDGSGKERVLHQGRWTEVPVLKISGVKVNVDTTVIPPDIYPPLLRPILSRLRFKGPVSLNELKLINEPGTSRLLIPQVPDITAIHQNINQRGYITSDLIAQILPLFLNPQRKLEELSKNQLDAATLANGVAPKRVKSVGLEIIGDPKNTPELSGLQLSLQTTR
jgi:hypothetical protein